jgi:hypothetical protein
MGNKDRGKREAKKPKKQTPKQPPPRREGNQVVPQIIREATEKT